MSEVTTLAGAAMLYTALVMWATQPPHTCAPLAEQHRRLSLGQPVDREHLDRDARDIVRRARRYAIRATAGTGASRDTSEVDRVAAQCQDTLARGVMQRHEVTHEQVLTALAAGR